MLAVFDINESVKPQSLFLSVVCILFRYHKGVVYNHMPNDCSCDLLASWRLPAVDASDAATTMTLQRPPSSNSKVSKVSTKHN